MNEIISAVVLLILIMDLLGNLPIFISALKHTESKRRWVTMVRELLITLLVMLVFPSASKGTLAFLSPRTETVSTPGGIILFPTVIEMIFPGVSGNGSELPVGEEPFITPLVVPLATGSTILATLMLLSHQYLNQVGYLMIVLPLAQGGTFIILLRSPLFLRLLGEKGVNTLGRLMGSILAVMATQMFLDGVRMQIKG